MFFVLAKHLETDEWFVVSSEHETLEEALEVADGEEKGDMLDRKWEYLVVSTKVQS